MRISAPGPKPTGVGLQDTGTLAQPATRREIKSAQRLWTRYHETAEQRQSERAKRFKPLPSPADVQRWSKRFSITP